MSNQLKIAFGLPAYGGVISAEHARMWMEIGSTISGSPERFQLVLFDFQDVNPISEARNTLVSNARAAGADWLFMLDADTWVESASPDEDAGSLILRMISQADREGASIVCAPVVRRRIGSLGPNERAGLMVWRGGVELSASLEEYLGDGLIEITACATACFAINIPRVQPIVAKHGELFQFKDGLSEDLYACGLVRETGGKLLCDLRVRTAHKSRSFPLYSR